MKVFFVLALLAAACPPAVARSAETPDPAAVAALASRKFLIGTWQCSFTVGSEGGTYSTIWSSILDGAWLKQTYDQPRQERAEAFQAEYFVGYDPRQKEWLRFGVMTTGQYFAIRMRDNGDGGWAWTYVSLFRPRPETVKPDAVFLRVSDTEYRVDGPTYPDAGGAAVTEHHVCKKT
jgi:hypothetical protein